MLKWIKNKLAGSSASDKLLLEAVDRLLVKSANNSNAIREMLVNGNSDWTGHDYLNLANNAYKKNVVAYTCITSIANACADVPIIIKINGKEVDLTVSSPNQQIAKKILRPNPMQSYKTFMQTGVSHRLIGGNTYLHVLQTLRGDLMEMTLMRPDRVTIQTTGNCIPYAYQYNLNGEMFYYPIDYDTWMSEVIQIKTFHPTDDLYGLSPLSAARLSIEQNNNAGEWNSSMLKNQSKLSGFISMVDRGDNGPTLSLEQMEKIKQMVNDKLAGPENAGKMPVFNHDMKFNALSLSPVDMDWLNGKQSTARDIAMAFNYPAFLLGFPEASTFNNVDSAKLSLYEDTVLPLLNIMLSEISYGLSKRLNIEIEIIPDVDRVNALAPRRDSISNNARLNLAGGIISVNEARQVLDYDDVPGGDEILVPAGKLPLNFDMSTMDEPKYSAWLELQGYTKEIADMYAKLAFTKDVK